MSNDSSSSSSYSNQTGAVDQQQHAGDTLVMVSASPPKKVNSLNFWLDVGLEILISTAVYAITIYGATKMYNRYFSEDSAVKAQARSKLGAKLKKTIQLTEHEMIIASNVVYSDEIETGFSDIGGLAEEKEEIFNLVALPLKEPELFAKVGTKLVTPPKGILLYGPPGTGKTMMAKAIAKESGASFINFSSATTISKYFGETEKLIAATFSLARKLSPCIIFIDEIDAMLRERSTHDHQHTTNVKAEFMTQWDGLATDLAPMKNNPAIIDEHNNNNAAGAENRPPAYGIVIIGATNRPGDVDNAILRRMPRTFELKLPDAEQRLDILRLFLNDVMLSPSLSASLSEFSEENLEGYSGSDLKELCRAAVSFPFNEFIERSKRRRQGHRLNAITAQQQQSILSGNSVVTSTPGIENRENAEEEEEQVDGLRELELHDFERALQHVPATGEAAYEYEAKTNSGTFRSRNNNASSSSSSPGRPVSEDQQSAYMLGMQHAFAMFSQAARSNGGQNNYNNRSDVNNNGNGENLAALLSATLASLGINQQFP